MRHSLFTYRLFTSHTHSERRLLGQYTAAPPELPDCEPPPERPVQPIFLQNNPDLLPVGVPGGLHVPLSNSVYPAVASRVGAIGPMNPYITNPSLPQYIDQAHGNLMMRDGTRHFYHSELQRTRFYGNRHNTVGRNPGRTDHQGSHDAHSHLPQHTGHGRDTFSHYPLRTDHRGSRDVHSHLPQRTGHGRDIVSRYPLQTDRGSRDVHSHLPQHTGGHGRDIVSRNPRLTTHVPHRFSDVHSHLPHATTHRHERQFPVHAHGAPSHLPRRTEHVQLHHYGLHPRNHDVHSRLPERTDHRNHHHHYPYGSMHNPRYQNVYRSYSREAHARNFSERTVNRQTHFHNRNQSINRWSQVNVSRSSGYDISSQRSAHYRQNQLQHRHAAVYSHAPRQWNVNRQSNTFNWQQQQILQRRYNRR